MMGIDCWYRDHHPDIPTPLLGSRQNQTTKSHRRSIGSDTPPSPHAELFPDPPCNTGGILLGPTAFGRIPGFTDHVFPSESRPYLSLVANIGLSLFLFLVGLEIDAGVVRRNAKMSMTVALAGMVIRKSMAIAILISVLNIASTCSVWFGCRISSTVVRPVRRQDGSVHAFHAICWSRVFHHRVSGPVSYPDGAQAFGHDCRNRCLVCRGRERYCGMDALGLECRLGECGFGTYRPVDPPHLCRLDVVLPSSGEESGFLGRNPNRLDH